MGLKRQLVPIVASIIRRMAARTRSHATIRDNITAGIFTNFSLDHIPVLETKHLHDARLFANREDLIQSLDSVKGGVVAEVGVALGEFSEFLLDELQPKKFVAFDTFTIYKWGGTWKGVAVNDWLKGDNHLDYYRKKFDNRPEVLIEVGMSHQTLARYPEKFFDLIYLVSLSG